MKKQQMANQNKLASQTQSEIEDTTHATDSDLNSMEFQWNWELLESESEEDFKTVNTQRTVIDWWKEITTTTTYY